MSKRSLNGWLKLGALCAVFFFAAAPLTSAAAEPTYSSQADEEELLRYVYASNITLMFVKVAQFGGNKPITPEKVAKIYKIAYEAFPNILARIKAAGFYDEYKRQLFDAKLRRMDARGVCARTAEEFKKPGAEQTSYMETKYPRLWEWMNSDAEAQSIVMQMFQEIAATLK